MTAEALVLTALFEQKRLSEVPVTPTGEAPQKLGDALAAMGGGLPVSTTPGTVAAGDDGRITGAVQA